MTPLPKRKHTHRRTGLRKHAATEVLSLPTIVKCSNCGKLRKPHTACPHCGFYR